MLFTFQMNEEDIVDDMIMDLVDENCPPWEDYPSLSSPQDEQEYGVVVNAICSENLFQ